MAIKSLFLYCSIATLPIIAALSEQYFNLLKYSVALYVVQSFSNSALKYKFALAPPTIAKFFILFCLNSFFNFCKIWSTAVF